MIENKTKHKSIFYFSATLIFLLLSLLFFVISPTAVVFASSTNVQDQYSAIRGETIYNATSSKQYRDITATNDNRIYESADNMYSWGNGANVINHSLDKLVFRLELTNANYEINDFISIYNFELFRLSDDGTSAVNTLSLLFVSENLSGLSMAVPTAYPTIWFGGIRRNTFTSEKIGLSDYGRNVDNGGSITTEWITDAWDLTYMTDQGYEYIYYNEIDYGESNYGNTQLFMYNGVQRYAYITIDVEDKYTRYFTRLNYTYANSDNRDNYNESNLNYHIDSPIASVYDVCKNMYDKNDLSLLSEDMQKQANILIGNGEVKEVQVSYLEQIGNTPFATKKYAYVEVPVKSGTIEPSDVANALGLPTLSVMQSSCMYFNQDPYTEIYHAYYLKNVWLSSKDANGHSVNMFLDINTSYFDYYKGLVNDGIMSDGMYEWLWNSMITAHNELLEYDDSELYGYFGYAVIPDVHSLNSLWNSLFNGGTSFDGVVKHFEYKQSNLTLDAYNTLLTEYGYSWLSKAWNDFMSFFDSDGASANHYFFYVDGEQDNAFIGENGADDIYDNGGAMQNGVEDTIEDLGKALKAFFDAPWTKWVAGFLLIFVLTWFIMFLSSSFFKVKKAKQEYQNAKKRKRKR